MSGGRRGKAKGTRAAGSKGVAAASASQARPVRSIAARFDAAQTTEENRKHWAMADALSADRAANPQIRRTLRNRARYEVANNSYAGGMIATLANATVGTGPRLQMLALSRLDALFVEREFFGWGDCIDLAEKLRTLRAARATDGEGFGLQIYNPALPSAVKLDLRLIEAEMVASTMVSASMTALIDGSSRNAVDGIRFDDAGNPIEYDVLRDHPGEGYGSIEARVVPASAVLHYFAPNRPGQRRGIPELTPALPLFAQLRRWTLSVLAAAETASDFAALMYTDQGPDGDAVPADPFDRVEIERRAMMTMPAGWKIEQLKAEQPTSTYAEVKHEIINEIARILEMPYNVAAGNSSSYNYSSGRLDHQTFAKALRVERMRMRSQLLERIFAAWKREAILIEGYLPQSLRNDSTDWSHDWFWDGAEHVDPLKEASAQALRLGSKTTTLADEWGRSGADWEAKLEQRAKELKKIKELEAEYGISMAEVPPLTPAADEQANQNADEPAAQPAKPPAPRRAR